MSSRWNEEVINSGNPTNSFKDEGNSNLQRTFDNGTGSGNINQQYHEYRTLTSGQSRNYDLRNVTGLVFNSVVNKTFTNVRSLYIKNYSTLTGQNVTVNVTSVSGFGEPFGYPAQNIALTPNSFIGNCSPFGWGVNSGDCQILLSNPSTGSVSYEIVIGGLS
jgi:hypothetical protein